MEPKRPTGSTGSPESQPLRFYVDELVDFSQVEPFCEDDKEARSEVTPAGVGKALGVFSCFFWKVIFLFGGCDV